MPEKICIRSALLEDAAQLLAVYAPYVRNTAITFEYEVPSEQEFAERILEVQKKYPYLTAVKEDGTLAGYAYAAPFHARAAYDWSVETSIYLREDLRGQGIGRILYTALEDALRHQHILNANACIAFPRGEDAHLTDASVRFHHVMGYQPAGHFHQCGYKFGTWYDMVWMEKMLGVHEVPARPVIPYNKTLY